MPTITANTVTANWNTNGAWAGGVQPTAADDVVIPSGAVISIPASTTVFCRSLSLTGTGTLTQQATGGTINCGDGTAGAGNVAISVANTATWNTTPGANPVVNLISTSTTQQTITSGGKTLPLITINGAGSSYLLGDALTVNGAFTLTAGTFDTGNYNLTMGNFTNGGSTTRTLTLGSSAITATGTVTNRSTNLTITSNTATFTLSGATIALSGSAGGSSIDWNGASFTFSRGDLQTVSFITGTTVSNLTVNGQSNKSSEVRFSPATLNISGTLSMTGGNNDTRRVFVNSTTVGSATTLSAATLGTCTRLDLQDITADGASAPWDLSAITDGSGDCLGNSNITFTTPVAQTMSSGGTWDVAANWTSRIPLAQDDVTVTGSSAITINQPRLGRNLDFSGYSGTATLTSASFAYMCFGDVTLGSSMSWGSNPNTFNITLAGRGTHTITSNGRVFFPAGSNATRIIAAPGGSYTLADNFLGNTPIGSVFNITDGTFNSANYQLDVGRFQSSGTGIRTVNLGTSVVNLHATGGQTLILTASTGLTSGMENATFNPIQASSSTKTFDLGGATIGTLNWNVDGNTGAVVFSSDGRIVTLNFSDASNARTLQITGGRTLTVDNFNVFGGASRLITVRSSSTALAHLSNPNGTIYNSLQDYIAYEYIQPVQPQSLWLGANSSQSNCLGILTSEPTYKHKQSTAAALVSATSTTVSYPNATTAGNLLVAYFASAGTQGTFTPPSGWTQAVTSSNGSIGYIFYKVADGTETNVEFSQTTARAINTTVVEYSGFSGTPTLDVTDSNSSGTAVTSLSTTATTGPTNTAQPALALAMVTSSLTMSNTVSISNSFLEDRTLTVASTLYKGAAKELTNLAAVETTFTWTSNRGSVTTSLAVFIDVITANMVKVKLGGTFVEKPRRVKIGGVFS